MIQDGVRRRARPADDKKQDACCPLTWALLALIMSRVELVPWLAELWVLAAAVCLFTAALQGARARAARKARESGAAR